MILPWLFKLSISYRNFAHFYRDFLTTLYIRLQPHGITNYSIGPHQASSDPNGAPRFKMDRKPKKWTENLKILRWKRMTIQWCSTSQVTFLLYMCHHLWFDRCSELEFGTLRPLLEQSSSSRFTLMWTSTRMPSGTNDVLDINDVVLLARRPRSSADWCWPKFQSQQTHRPCSQHKTRCWQETYQQKHMQAEHTTQAKWQHASANMNVSYVQTYGECYYEMK